MMLFHELQEADTLAFLLGDGGDEGFFYLRCGSLSDRAIYYCLISLKLTFPIKIFNKVSLAMTCAGIVSPLIKLKAKCRSKSSLTDALCVGVCLYGAALGIIHLTCFIVYYL